MFAGESFASSTCGVERVGLGALSTRWSLWPIEFDHDLALFNEVSCEASAVSACALNGPHPQRRMLICHRDQTDVAVMVRRLGLMFDLSAGRCSHNSGGLGVLVSVDADYNVYGF